MDIGQDFWKECMSQLFKTNELKSCPKCGQRNFGGRYFGGATYIPGYTFRRKGGYCDGSACIIAPLTEEHMHYFCDNCGYQWAEELPKKPEFPPDRVQRRRTFWEWLADKLGVDCL